MKSLVNVKRVFLFTYIIGLVAMLLLPSLKYTFSTVQVLIFSVPFVAFALIEGKTYRKVFGINMILLAITFLSSFVFNYKGGISGVLNIVVPMYLYILPLLICQYLIDLNDKKLMKWVTVAIVAILLYVLVITFRQLLITPAVTRLLAYGTEDDPYINQLRMDNIGGFGFCYCLCVLVPYVATLIDRVKRKRKTIVVILLIVLFIFSVYSQYTTFVLLSLISLFYVILTQGRFSVKKFIVLALLLLVTIFHKQILWYLANNLNLSGLASHFYDLYYILEGEEELGRWSLIVANIGMFLKNPIFGADLTVHYNNYLTGHAHSTIFGRLSGGGIVGIGCYAGFIATAWYYLARIKKMRKLIPVFLIYIVLACLNPVTPEISVTAFLLIPLIEYQLINKEEQLYV